jgi:uracil-DNA glycosylase
MNPILQEIKRVIKDNNLYNYLRDYAWLTGYLGNFDSRVWFIGENPRLRGVISVHNRHSDRTENLQWNSHDGDRLFREALTEAGFKSGEPNKDEGWDCYITNSIKEPEIVKDRNVKKGDANYWKTQALCWLPILQLQIEHGKPIVLVAIGKTAFKILEYMKSNGLVAPQLDLIPHYSYIMFRPDSKTGLGPRHPRRIKEFKNSIYKIKKLYSA